MIRTFLKTAAVVTLSVGTAVSTASAQIGATGLLNVSGSAQIRTAQVGNPLAPVQADFLTGGATGFGTAGTVEAQGQQQGIFSFITDNTPGTMNDVQFTGAPAAPSLVTVPTGSPLLTIGGFNFFLGDVIPATGGTLTFGPVRLTDGFNGADARIDVRGTFTGPGVPAGLGIFQGILTAQFTGQSSAQVFNAISTGSAVPVSFSANLNAQVIPEPSTYALLATGIAGLGLVARRRRQQA